MNTTEMRETAAGTTGRHTFNGNDAWNKQMCKVAVWRRNCRPAGHTASQSSGAGGCLHCIDTALSMCSGWRKTYIMTGVCVHLFTGERTNSFLHGNICTKWCFAIPSALATVSSADAAATELIQINITMQPTLCFVNSKTCFCVSHLFIFCFSKSAQHKIQRIKQRIDSLPSSTHNRRTHESEKICAEIRIIYRGLFAMIYWTISMYIYIFIRLLLLWCVFFPLPSPTRARAVRAVMVECCLAAHIGPVAIGDTWRVCSPLDRRVCRTLRMCSLRGNSVMQPNRKTNMKIYDLRRKPEGGWGNGLRGGWGPSVHHAWPVSFSIPHIHIVRWACCFLYAILWIMRQHFLLVINSNGDSCETDKNWCTIEWICFWCGKMRPAFVNVRCGRGMGISIPWPIRMMLLMPPLPGSAFNQRLLLLFSSLMFK